MSKKEAVEKEIDFLKEEFRSYFLLLTALLSGEATLIYAVISKSKPLYVLFLAIIGFILSITIFSKLKDIKDRVYILIERLKD